MTIETPKPTQVQIEGLNLRNVFDNGFLGTIEKAIGRNPHYISVQLMALDDDNGGETITLFHTSKDNADKNILNVDATKPETLDKVIKNIIQYYEGCTDD